MIKQYQKAIENSNIVSKTNAEGIITFVNDEFCKSCGYTREELIGQNHNIVRHPDVPAEVLARAAAAAELPREDPSANTL